MCHSADSPIKQYSVAIGCEIRQLNGVWSRALLCALFYPDFIVDLNLNTLNLHYFAFEIYKPCTTLKKDLL